MFHVAVDVKLMIKMKCNLNQNQNIKKCRWGCKNIKFAKKIMTGILAYVF